MLKLRHSNIINRSILNLNIFLSKFQSTPLYQARAYHSMSRPSRSTRCRLHQLPLSRVINLLLHHLFQQALRHHHPHPNIQLHHYHSQIHCLSLRPPSTPPHYPQIHLRSNTINSSRTKPRPQSPTKQFSTLRHSRRLSRDKICSYRVVLGKAITAQ